MNKTKKSSFEKGTGFKCLFQNSTIGILVVNRRGQIEFANSKATELFGYQCGDLANQSLEILIPSSLKQKYAVHCANYFWHPRMRSKGKNVELSAQKKNGEIFPLEINLGHYELEGELLAVAFINDISIRKKKLDNLKQRVEELDNSVNESFRELSRAQEREKELNELKIRFLSMASSEFRKPLNSIVSGISLLEKYTGRWHEDKRMKHLNRVKSSAKTLNGMLEDFLSFEILHQGKTNVTDECFNLEELIADIKESKKKILKPGQVIHHTHKGGHLVVSDKKIIGSILCNLLSNAIKYSYAHGTIELNTEVTNDSASITVKDNGNSIPAKDQKNLSEIFRRSPNPGPARGTGLELNIVKQYTDLLGGTVIFSSNINTGTTFKVEFPNKPGTAGAAL